MSNCLDFRVYLTYFPQIYAFIYIPNIKAAQSASQSVKKEDGGHPLLAHGYVPGGSHAVKVALSTSLACF